MRTLLAALLGAATILGTGCATVQSPPGNQVTEFLTPSGAFRMKLPPFFHAEVPYGARIPVVGTVERDGTKYRVVVLPDQSAAALKILINADGSFQGSAINMTGSMMGFNYESDPPGIRLIPLGTAVPAHSYAGVACDTMVPAQRRECEDSHLLEGLDAYGRKAEDDAVTPAIQKLVRCIAASDRTLLPLIAENMLSGVQGSSSQLGEGRVRITKCADDNVKAAVESAASANDLRDAIKILYVKERAWADSLVPNGTQTKLTYREDVSRATSELDQAISKVQLETKLAPAG